jgi:uncharacterized protein (TIGR02246 family)
VTLHDRPENRITTQSLRILNCFEAGMSDKDAIRKLVDNWLESNKKGDIESVLQMMTDDVVFMVQGREPFGKEAFASFANTMRNVAIDGTSEIQEIEVLGDWAWMRNRLRMTMSPPTGKPMRSSGYTLTILKKNTEGNWLIARDANLLAPEKDSGNFS